MSQKLTLKEQQLQRKLKIFRDAQADRRRGLPCGSANGTYLDGWYAPNKLLPDFLTWDVLEKIEHYSVRTRIAIHG